VVDGVDAVLLFGWHAGKAFDSIPNFTASDILRVLQIGRNEYIQTVNECRYKGWRWKVSKSRLQAAIPSLPRPDIACHSYWVVIPHKLAPDSFSEIEYVAHGTLQCRAQGPLCDIVFDSCLSPLRPPPARSARLYKTLLWIGHRISKGQQVRIGDVGKETARELYSEHLVSFEVDRSLLGHATNESRQEAQC